MDEWLFWMDGCRRIGMIDAELSPFDPILIRARDSTCCSCNCTLRSDQMRLLFVCPVTTTNWKETSDSFCCR